MIGKLRKKLILAAMGSLFLVLLLIMGGVACLNYIKIISDAYSTLSLLAQNDSFFPNTKEFQHSKGRKGEPYGNLPPELPFETRYFFVTIDVDGSIKTVNTGKVAATDTETAIEYAQTVWQSGKEQGFLGNYRYLQSQKQDGTLILFLDCRRNLDSFQTLLFSSILASLGGATLVFVLLLFFSKKIVKPFSESYEKQKRFITDAGHELKTPLTIIDADAEILTMDIGENEWLKEIRHQTKRLATLTNELIFLSRMEEERPAQMKVFCLLELLTSTIQSFDGVAKMQNKQISSNIQPNLFLCGDKKSIQKLLTILLDNALKYMPSQGVVTCELATQKNQLKLLVSNPSETLNKEQISRLFDRFYRTDDSRNSQTGGYGLGLSIAQAIVTAHKGKITAYTTDESSLTISLTLPQARL